MDLKLDYVEYALQATLSILAVSSIYLADTSSKATLLLLVAVPVLLAYTAYTSTRSFQKSSLTSLITLFFVPLGPLYATAAIFVSSSNIMISFFSSGETFKQFYTSTTLPMLFSGLIIGLSVFTMLSLNPGTAQTLSETLSNTLSTNTQQITEKIGLNISEGRTEFIKTVSTLTVSMTRSYVMNSTSDQLSPQDMQNVSNAFEEAKNTVPDRITEEASGRTLEKEELIQNTLSQILSGPMMPVVIPVVAGLIYALHPVVGILVAISGVLIGRIDGYLSETL